MPDHVHMCIAIPPKHPVASVIGFLTRRSRNQTGPDMMPEWASNY
jgi:REP element-mobilizing transposase RayT